MVFFLKLYLIEFIGYVNFVKYGFGKNIKNIFIKLCLFLLKILIIKDIYKMLKKILVLIIF